MPNEEKENEISQKLIRAFLQFRRLRFEQGGEPQECKYKQIRHSEMMVLFALKDLEDKYPSGISVSDLSGCLRIKPPTITPSINNLENYGMVERKTDKEDRRVIRVYLTQEGNRLIEYKNDLFLKRTNGLVSYLGAEKSEMLAELIGEVFTYVSAQTHSKKK